MSKSNVTRKITTQRVKKNLFFSHLNTFGTPSRLRSSPSFPSRGSMPFNISLGSTGPPAMSETQWRVNILVNTSNSVLHVLLRKAVFCLFLNNKYSTDVYIGPFACQILSSRTPPGNMNTIQYQNHPNPNPSLLHHLSRPHTSTTKYHDQYDNSLKKWQGNTIHDDITRQHGLIQDSAQLSFALFFMLNICGKLRWSSSAQLPPQDKNWLRKMI